MIDLNYIGSNQRAAIKLILSMGEITVRDLQYHTGRDKRDCKKALDRLVNRGIVSLELKKGFIRTKNQTIPSNRITSHYSLINPSYFKSLVFY